MDIKEFKKFLVKAKINTYASKGEGGERIFSDGSKELKFKEGDFKYQDKYFGFNPFMGEEIVFYKGKMVWGMNYYGEAISKKISPKRIYQFLRKALKAVKENKPFRGPENFKEEDFKYINKVLGNVKKFNGNEKILWKNKEVYKLIYHGGIIS